MASNGNAETSRLVNVESAEVYGCQERLSDLSGSLANASESKETGDSVPLIQSPMVWRLPRGMSYNPKHTSSGDMMRTLGTFAGVFCPVALAQFSTMLFLRTGMIVGQSGILLTTVMMVLAYLILLLTVFSICAISTNGAVEGGGAYYMISRALGPEFGGSIGLLIYVANIFSCALYVAGFTEAILDNFSTGGSVTMGTGLPADCAGCWWKYLYSSVVLLLCLLVCIVGGSLFGKTQVVIVLITIVCTLSAYISVFAKSKVINIGIPKDNHRFPNNTNLTFQYTGLSAHTFHENTLDSYTNYEGKKVPSFQEDYSTNNQMNFTAMFAILFSSITGIMNGANMSGELKDPSKSIPKGTLGAIFFTFTTYMILFILIGGSCSRDLLINNYLFLQDINLWNGMVLIGIFATTLSAALGNLIGGSRILEALANDQLFGRILNPATKTTKGGNPYMAVLITWFLVQLVMLVGSLNIIAQPTTVFFLLAYASVNLACAALDLASAPNFRPTFRFYSWHLSLVGLVGCLIMCFLISVVYSSVTIIFMLIMIIGLHFRALPFQWGSISQALIFHQVRKYLLMLDIRKAHVKYWRPHILLMVSRPRQSSELIDFINDIKKGGLYVLGHVRVGHLDDHPDKDPIHEEFPKWLKLVDTMQIKAFVELSLARTVCDGLHQLIRSTGLGGMKINTVCLGFYDNSQSVDVLSKRQVSKRGLFGKSESRKLEIGEHFRGIRLQGGMKDLTAREYVKMVADSLKMHKNVLLCRHFNMLDKNYIKSSKGNLFIDVWPVNFFRPETASYFDNTCLFLLQLSCIINMVPGWKSKTTLRVFLFVNANTDNALKKEQKLETYLRQLRILAKIQTVPWKSIEKGSDLNEFDISVNYPDCQMQEYNRVSDAFLTAVNTTIKSASQRTALTFLYLPRPPKDSSQLETYLEQLTSLSVDLPPTVFVHGLHPVTSTTL